MKIHTPLDVPEASKQTYEENYKAITHDVGRLMLFAGDQKIEHLNDDFYGKGIPAEDNDPEHLFKIASQAKIGVFASQLGLIARYGADYKDIPYLVKMNSKSHLIGKDQRDPLSAAWYGVSQVMELKKNAGLNILGIGYTLYLGSDFEPQMLSEAARLIYEAHRHGLLSVVWCYPRGKAVPNEKDAHLIAGAAATAAVLGSDFIKVNPPSQDGKSDASLLQEATQAAGRSGVVCAGGSSATAETFLQGLYDQIHTGGTIGNATGRNIHQKPLGEAVRFANSIFAVTVENKSVKEAMKIYQG
ncbi:aldolase [Candidatus Roizmanbacteria bacterium CG11_big_fil_rev_8_21_14_0_20_36_8]|uniref:fructose-bisphosphate aldolase n=1 Tax=Candidatus Roizmanbacteria bacterium CG11_big_fil_rev_8_21_14_0_20_36_8 TaxID=1974856 RepID=A0A2M6IV74_9BACT|nr:MAG: aldolase [Candidatus Roizmanbacteria bacterium CG11_big_fil_rev_8_21_14_0_20_36_8]